MSRIATLLPRLDSHLQTVGPDTPLTEAATLLGETPHHLLVVKAADGTMAGVVTRTDIVRAVRHCQGSTCTSACASVMTRSVVACDGDDRLQDIWQVMKERGVQAVPVIDDQRRPIGLLTARDALEELLSEVEHQDELLREYVASTGYR